MSSERPPERVYAEQRSSAEVEVRRFDDSTTDAGDVVAVEEPLEIQLVLDGRDFSLSITMRTPGQDEDLAAGFLFTEGIIDRSGQIWKSIYHETKLHCARLLPPKMTTNSV